MAKYRVTLRATTVETVEAPNPYQAAIAVSDRHGGDVEVTQVVSAVGRAPATDGRGRAVKKQAAKKAPAKKRRRLSPEARAKLAQNLVKARAARAAKRKSAAAKKRPTIKKRP